MKGYKISHSVIYSKSMAYAIIEFDDWDRGVYYVSKKTYDDSDYQELDINNKICNIINNGAHKVYNLILETDNGCFLVYCVDNDRVYIVDDITVGNGWCRDYSDSNLNFIDEL